MTARNMTFAEFQATRTWSEDLNASLPDQEFGTFENSKAKGFVYLDELTIEAVHGGWSESLKALGTWYLIIGNVETFSFDLRALESQLYGYAIAEGMVSGEPFATELCAKWVAALGEGFHPDARAEEYHPGLSPQQAVEYEADMVRLFAVPGVDAYATCLHAMRAAGLTPDVDTSEPVAIPQPLPDAPYDPLLVQDILYRLLVDGEAEAHEQRDAAAWVVRLTKERNALLASLDALLDEASCDIEATDEERADFAKVVDDAMILVSEIKGA